jgi:hypothetical protein
MKTEIARKLSDEMNDIMARLDESVRLVMDNCAEDEFKGYRTESAVSWVRWFSTY